MLRERTKTYSLMNLGLVIALFKIEKAVEDFLLLYRIYAIIFFCDILQILMPMLQRLKCMCLESFANINLENPSHIFTLCNQSVM